MKRELVALALIWVILLPLMFSMLVFSYDDYESYWVDSQNPEVQRIIRETCVFPLEDYLITNLKRLYWALSFRFSYDHTLEHAWQTIPEMLRQDKGVCDDFARLYHSLLRGIGWPRGRIRRVWGPVYDLWGNFIDNHAWVEIRTPSPFGTSLETFASQAVEDTEGAQLPMGFNETILTLPEITQERIQEVKTLGWGTRDGWIPIDPTMGVGVSEIPIIGWFLVTALPSFFLSFGYNVFNLAGFDIHMDEVYTSYPWHGGAPDRENPSWDNLTVTIEPGQSFNVSYLHSVSGVKNVSSTVNSSRPIDFQIKKQRSRGLEIATDAMGEEAFNVTSHWWFIFFSYDDEPYWPHDIGVYWFIVHNLQTEPLNVTFGAFVPAPRFVALPAGRFDSEMYDQYSEHRDIGITNIHLAKTVVGLNYTSSINVTIMNYGVNTEVSNITLYANTTIIDTLTDITLTSGSSTTLTLIWNTTGLVKGNYHVSAYATPVPDEIYTEDNTLTNGDVMVTTPGDINGDRMVDTPDLSLLANAYGSTSTSSNWNPNADINNDGLVNIFDVRIASVHWGQSW